MNYQEQLKTTKATNCFKLNPELIAKNCFNCVYANETFEEAVGDGGAPCKRCVHFDGED